MNEKSHKIIVVTPAGRKKYLQVLFLNISSKIMPLMSGICGIIAVMNKIEYILIH